MTKISWLVNLMELRKDYFQNKWVIIAEKRGVRPHEFKKLEETVEGSVCYFCPGSEGLTPPEIMRIGKPWRVRVFPNKFPAVDGSGQLSGFQPIMDAKLLPAIGTHEVIVETPDHMQQLADLPPKGFVRYLTSILSALSSLRRRAPSTCWSSRTMAGLAEHRLSTAIRRSFPCQ